MASLASLYVVFFVPIIGLYANTVNAWINPVMSMGINYGRIADNLPSPPEAVALIKRLGFGKVKIFDTDTDVLQALADTGLKVTIGVTNQELPPIASSQDYADQWVQSHVAPFYPRTQINFINVGNEVLSNGDLNSSLWYQLVPAMENIHTSLVKLNLHHRIKVTTSCALDILQTSYPPSRGAFKDSIAMTVMQPMLKLLQKSRSYFFLNVYPYLTWSANPNEIPLSYALLQEQPNPLFSFNFNRNPISNSNHIVQDGDLIYNNLLDAQLDAVASAITKLGYPNLRIAISETGWPTNGDPNQPGANVENAIAYNQRLIKKMMTYPPIGTPLRRKVFIPTYIFALFNEDQKPGPTTERNWGLLYPNGQAVYNVDMDPLSSFFFSSSFPSPSTNSSSASSPSP